MRWLGIVNPEKTVPSDAVWSGFMVNVLKFWTLFYFDSQIKCKFVRAGSHYNKQGWPWSDCFLRSTLIWVCPFLAHLSRRLLGELLVYQWLRRPSVRPSVCQHFQTSSPLKPLGQLNSNFIWRLLRMGERKFVQMFLGTWPRWPPCPYMVKTL